MNIADLMDEIGTALEALDGLRVHPYWADSITPPSATVGWPDPLTYDAAYQRGGDRLTLPLWVLVGRADARTSRDRMAKYLNGTGPDSVKVAVDGGTYTACDSVTVTEATVGAITVGGTEYLGATFQVDIFGQG